MRSQARGEEHQVKRPRADGSSVGAMQLGAQKYQGLPATTRGRERDKGGFFPGALDRVQPYWKPEALDLRLLASRTIILL